jgi:hypothetical protein
MKTIDIIALEWFDTYGNSYFAATVTINYGLPDVKTFTLPFQYGYGDHYKDMAFKEIEKQGLINDREHYSNGSAESLWRYCERKKIIVRCTKHEKCKQRELKQLA